MLSKINSELLDAAKTLRNEVYELLKFNHLYVDVVAYKSDLDKALSVLNNYIALLEVYDWDNAIRLPSIINDNEEPTEDQVRKYCRKRGLVVLTADAYYRLQTEGLVAHPELYKESEQ